MLSKRFRSRHFQITALLALLHGGVVCNIASAQDTDGRALPRLVSKEARLVSKEEGRALAQTALHHWPQMRDKPDCSHLVHDVYVEAGLNYEYATTNDIFDGIESFERVSQPQAGDLVVWQGHVGIVIDPEDNSFYSSVITGFSVSSFSSSYWESRGPRRFYRYKISAAQAARLLRRASGRKVYAKTVRPESHEPTDVTVRKIREDDSPGAEPDLPERNVRRDTAPGVPSENRIAGAVVTAASRFPKDARKPTKEQIRSAFVQLSDRNAAQWQQSTDLNGPFEIVDGFEAGRVEIQGSWGWAELNVTTMASFADGRMIATKRTKKIRFMLLQQTDGWTLQAPANHSYLLRTAAVRMITARLAVLAHDPDNAKDLKGLNKALGFLLAEGT
jgi:hypothetical protein